MALVLPMFISKLFLLQKQISWSNSYYSSVGDGAKRTRSSAKANINSWRDAMV